MIAICGLAYVLTISCPELVTSVVTAPRVVTGACQMLPKIELTADSSVSVASGVVIKKKGEPKLPYKE